MKHYTAIITGGTMSPDCVMLEQDRVAFAASFMEAAMQHAFYCICQDGIDAQQQPYAISFYSDGVLFARINITTWQELLASMQTTNSLLYPPTRQYSCVACASQIKEEEDTMNSNLLSASRHAQVIMTELCEAQVTVLAMRIDMDYKTPAPHPFHFFIHARNDENFAHWAVQYHAYKSEHETIVPFLEGQVFTIHD